MAANPQVVVEYIAKTTKLAAASQEVGLAGVEDRADCP